MRFTTAGHGDLRVTQPQPALLAARADVLDRPWSWVRQVHGAQVVQVEAPGEQAGQSEADALVTVAPGAVLAIHTADCAPVALVSPEGVVAAVHAGWRGLEAGVLQAALEQMWAAGARQVQAVLGPCIHAECYEFGPELDGLAARFGPEVRGMTAAGKPALDVPAVVRGALQEVQRPVLTGSDVVDVCTACDTRFFSYRARADTGRQVLLVYIEPDGEQR